MTSGFVVRSLCLLGFLVTVNVRQSSTQNASSSTRDICDEETVLLMPDDIFYIKSTNYDIAKYSNNLSCSIKLRTLDVPLILTLEVRDFSVEYVHSCSYDALCIFGVEFCGTWLTDTSLQYIVPEFSWFTLHFRSDNSLGYRGFSILVSTAKASGDVVEVSGGTGSSASSVVTSQQSYYAGYRDVYTDKCAPSTATSSPPPLSTTDLPTTYFPITETPATSSPPPLSRTDLPTTYFPTESTSGSPTNEIPYDSFHNLMSVNNYPIYTKENPFHSIESLTTTDYPVPTTQSPFPYFHKGELKFPNPFVSTTRHPFYKQLGHAVRTTVTPPAIYNARHPNLKTPALSAPLQPSSPRNARLPTRDP